MNTSVISKVGLKPDTLRDETVVITGAGGGIGYEAARAMLWLGANVVIAEIDEAKGSQAAQNLREEFDPTRVLYVPTDVGDETSAGRWPAAGSIVMTGPTSDDRVKKSHIPYQRSC